MNEQMFVLNCRFYESQIRGFVLIREARAWLDALLAMHRAAMERAAKKPCYPERQSEWYEAMGIGDG